MAVKTLYVLGTAAPSPNFYGQLQDGGSAPSAANSTYGWAPAKTALTSPYYQARLGASSTQATASTTSTIDSKTIPTKGTGATNATSGDSFVTPVAYTGAFAATAWTFNWNMRAGVAGCVGRIRMQVFASVNADGTSARKLTSSTQLGTIVTLSTSADTNSSISWSPGAITLANEYLFFQVEWQETTVGSSNSDTVLFRIGTSIIVTPNLAINLVLSFSSPQALTVSAVNPSLITDNFNRADGPLGPKYTQGATNPAPLGIVSNQVYGSVGAWELACYTASSFKNDQFSQITQTSSGDAVGVLVRMQSNGDSGYIAFLGSGSGTVTIARIDNHAFTNLNSGAVTGGGKILRLEISGSTLTAKVNGVVICTATDSTYTSGYPGIAGINGETSDNWSAGPSFNVVTDNFNRANGSLGPNWTDSILYPGLGISSNQAVNSTGSWMMSYWSSNIFLNNQFAEVTVSSGIASVLVRCQSDGSGYLLSLNTSTQGLALYRTDNVGGFTPLNSKNDGTYLPGDVIRLEISGSLLTAYESGNVAFTATDSVYSSGSPGIAANNGVADNWSGGPIVLANIYYQLISFISSEVIALLSVKSLSKLALISSSETLTIIRQKIYQRTISPILSHQVVTNLWTANRSFLALLPQTQTISKIKAVSKLIPAFLNPQAASLSKIGTYFRTLLFTSPESVTAVRSASKTLTATSSQLVTAIKQFVPGVQVYQRLVSLLSPQVVTASKVASFFRTIVISSPQAISYSKQIGKSIVTLLSPQTVSITKIASFFRTLTISSSQVVSSGKIATLVRTLALSSSQIVSTARVVSRLRTLTLSSSQVISYSKQIGKTIVSLLSPQVVSFARITSRFRTVVLSSSQIVSYYKQIGKPVLLFSFESLLASRSILKKILISSPQFFNYTSRKIVSASANFDGASSIAFAGKEIASAQVNADGLTDVAFAGSTAFIGTGIVSTACQADGVATVSFVGQEVASAKVNADGVSTVSFTGQETVSARVNADGISTVNFTGNGIVSARANADGIASVSFVGHEIASVKVNADGIANVNFTGNGIAQAKLNTDGVSTVNFTGHELASARVNADGVVDVNFVGSTSFQGIGIVSGAARADGSVSVAFAGKEIASAVVNADGLANVSFIGHEIASARVNADGIASAAFTGSLLLKAVASFDGVSSVDFRGAYLQSGAVRADGISNALFTGSLATIGYGQMDGQAMVLFYGAEEFIFDPNILRAGYVLKIEDYLHVTDWKAIADGVHQDIGVELNIARGDVLLSYTPSLYDDPDQFTQNVYFSGDIFTTTENKVIWIKPADPDYPISAKGEILYLSA